MAYKYKVAQGDTLNTIASRFGFSNYKEAGISSVPSGDFDAVSPGDEITLANYDPNKVTTIGSTPSAISSNDVAGEYKSASSNLDEKLNENSRAYRLNDGSMAYFSGEVSEAELAAKNGKTLPKTGEEEPKPKTGDEPKPGTAEADPLYQSMLKSEAAGKASADAWAAAQNLKINALLPKTLSLLDAQYASSVSNITNTYTKLIDEQKIINSRSIDRTKAYGLSHGAQYVPLEFSDAISEKETKAANEIAGLENSRNDLLAKAKQARDLGEITSLRENMKDLNTVEETMRQRTKDLADEVQKRYELVVAARKEAETKQKETVQKALAAASIQHLDDFKNAKDEKAKDKIVRQIILDSAGTLTDADYYSVYTALNSAVTSAKDKSLATRKTEAEIKSTEALAKDRTASAAKSYAEAAVKSTEKKTQATMKADIDAISFKTTENELKDKKTGKVTGKETVIDEDDAERKRQAFVKKYGEAGKKYWDNIYQVGTNPAVYDYQLPEESEGGVMKSPDGTQQVSISDLTPAEIEEAKKAGWK